MGASGSQGSARLPAAGSGSSSSKSCPGLLHLSEVAPLMVISAGIIRGERYEGYPRSSVDWCELRVSWAEQRPPCGHSREGCTGVDAAHLPSYVFASQTYNDLCQTFNDVFLLKGCSYFFNRLWSCSLANAAFSCMRDYPICLNRAKFTLHFFGHFLQFGDGCLYRTQPGF